MILLGQIVTGRKLILPPYPLGTVVYAVNGDLSNSINEMRTFDALYLRPNADGGGHFVYNIDTMQRNSACRVIGSNKKPIPMTDLIIKVINSQASREKAPAGVELSNIDKNTTEVDYEP